MVIRDFLGNPRVDQAGEEIKNAGKLILDLFENPDSYFGTPQEVDEEAMGKEVVTEEEKREAITVHAEEEAPHAVKWACAICRDEGRLGHPGHYVPCPSAVHGGK